MNTMMRKLKLLTNTIRWKVILFFARYFYFDFVSREKIQRVDSLVKLGSDYCGWIIPVKLLNEKSICYCAGVGEEISFDLSLIAEFGCKVYAFDPTPRAVKYIEKTVKNNPKYHFSEIGLWDDDTLMRFYAPADSAHVSHSILNLQKTESYFNAPCKRLSTIIKANGHSKLDLLKLDVEGAEYKVIESILADNIRVDILCVEYDEANNSLDNLAIERIRRSVTKICRAGYSIVYIDRRANYTFVRNEVLQSGSI